MTRLAAAVAALERGFHIFPVQPNEKTPHKLWANKPYTIRWSEVATNDYRQVVSWWTKSPNANIGIAAKPSGIIVVDCDLPKSEYLLRGTTWEYLHERFGPLVDGNDVLREMCGRYGDDYARLERTYRVQTASMGLHLYFTWPASVQASQASPVNGLLDIRCNGGCKGGYVLGAGSATEKGAYVAENALPVAAAPAWLVELCREKPRPVKPKSPYNQPRSANFGGLVEAVTYAQEGNRNNVCLWAARSMCEDRADIEDALRLLVPAAQACGLDVRDAEATIRSAYRLQEMKNG